MRINTGTTKTVNVNKFKALCTDEKLKPTRAHTYDAGLDLRSSVDITIRSGDAVSIDTGFAMAIPVGFVGFVCSRSGHGKPEIRVSLTNRVGVIDAGYIGNISVTLENQGNQEFHVKKYDRIAQLVITKCWTGDFDYVDKLISISDRGTGGHGSTGVA